jgi:hypothetical protein
MERREKDPNLVADLGRRDPEKNVDGQRTRRDMSAGQHYVGEQWMQVEFCVYCQRTKERSSCWVKVWNVVLIGIMPASR